MKKILVPSLIAIAAIAVLATTFTAVGAAEANNNYDYKSPFLGNLTEDQRELLQEKKEEMRENWQELKNLEPEERHEKVQELKTELGDWAEENGIELPGGKGFMGRGLRKGGFGQPRGDCPFAE